MRKGLTLYMEIEETDIDTPYRYQNNSKVWGEKGLEGLEAGGEGSGRD